MLSVCNYKLMVVHFMEVSMKRFVKVQLLLAFVLGLVLAGCDFVSDDEDEKSGGSGNSSGNEGSSQGVPVLVEGAWTDGTISKDGQTDRYSINVAARTRYFIHLNDIDDGDGTKTADIGLKIYHSDGTTISGNYSSVQDCWKKPFTFLASGSGTITITAAAYASGWEHGVGTYAIKYTTRPEYDTLYEGVWKDDSIIVPGQTNKYSITVQKGMKYFIWLNDAGDGNGTKTADVGLKIVYSQEYHNENSVICGSYGDADCLWSKPFIFEAPIDGVIIITTAATIVNNSIWHNYKWGEHTGTYAIKYTAGS